MFTEDRNRWLTYRAFLQSLHTQNRTWTIQKQSYSANVSNGECRNRMETYKKHKKFSPDFNHFVRDDLELRESNFLRWETAEVRCEAICIALMTIVNICCLWLSLVTGILTERWWSTQWVTWRQKYSSSCFDLWMVPCSSWLS